MIGAARRHGGRALGVGVQGVLAAAAFVALAWLRDRGAASVPGAWPRELAPLVAGLVACGPLAAGGAAELARMRVEGQVDALRAMGGSVWRHVVVPRLLAGMVAVPLLVALADAVGLALVQLPLGPGGAAAPAPTVGDLGIGLVRGALAGALLAALACGVGLAGGRADGPRPAWPAGVPAWPAGVAAWPAGVAARPAAVGARAAALGVAAVLGLQLLLGGALLGGAGPG